VCLPVGELPPPERQVQSSLECGSGDVCWRAVSDGVGGGPSDGAGGTAACSRPQRAADCLDVEPALVSLTCFKPDSLRDRCSPVHLLSLNDSGAAGSSGTEPVGDGGTSRCPSADELFWNGDQSGCGCSYEPACVAPTTDTGTECCYPVQISCLLC
jgi:hypothetical protein